MPKGPVGVAVIGAGNISKQYLDNLVAFPDLAVHVVASRSPETAMVRAKEYGIGEYGSPEVALAHPDVEIIVNLTIPAVHADIDLAALRAGKHVWSEKPIALDRTTGKALLAEAEASGLRIGCAPDTFLGPGLQTARRVLERGDIGVPLTALTLLQTPGPEAWHPNPAFLYERGAGPLFDIGPYYLTALVQLFGSVRRVAAIGSKSRPTRVVGSGPRAGEAFDVEVPTHVGAVAAFQNGTSSNSIFSFESPLTRKGFVEITGTEGVLSVPNPDHFDGRLQLFRAGAEDWIDVPTAGPANGRGMGVLDMARSIRAGVPHRASGQLAYHVLDVMTAMQESIETGSFVDLHSSAPIAAAVPEDWGPNEVTLAPKAGQ